jgi:hypothetical protein
MGVYLNEPADIKYNMFSVVTSKGTQGFRMIAQQILNVWFSETYPSEIYNNSNGKAYSK